MDNKLIISSRTFKLLLALAIAGFVTCIRLAAADEEQALIVTIRLHKSDAVDADELRRIKALEDQLAAAIKQAAGDFDGDEFGKGVCTIYMYGPSAERLFAVTVPILKKFHPPAGSFVIKRFGKPGSKQERVELSDEKASPAK